MPKSTLLKYKVFSNKARPLNKQPWDAGYDLHSAENITVKARGHSHVKTDIGIELPIDTYGRIAPRSGLALHFQLDVGAGVIDSGYRGPIGVILFNHSDKDFEINRGDRIAQLIIQKIALTTPVQVEHLSNSERGTKGLGSSGLKPTEDLAKYLGVI